jgi:hypothetical protein
MEWLKSFFLTMSEVAVQTMKQCHFVICNQCYWCATDLSGGSLLTCRGCGNEEFVESIALQPKEKYSFAVDIKRGMTLEFL